MAISSLAVFCGSKEGNNQLFCEHARQLGYLLAAKNITLVYGGSNKGIMAAVANAVMKKGGKVVGVMPKLLNGLEHSHYGLSELHETEDMHSRKKMIYTKNYLIICVNTALLRVYAALIYPNIFIVFFSL